MVVKTLGKVLLTVEPVKDTSYLNWWQTRLRIVETVFVHLSSLCYAGPGLSLGLVAATHVSRHYSYSFICTERQTVDTVIVGQIQHLIRNSFIFLMQLHILQNARCLADKTVHEGLRAQEGI